MSKFHILAAKCAATVATVATFGSSTVATLFPQSSNTVATLMVRRIRALFPSKTSIFGASSSNSSNTFPNSFHKNAFEGEPYSGDEYDVEDFEDWLEGEEYPDDDDFDDLYRSWEHRAVDEIIASEKPGEYPGADDIPF